MPTSLGPLEPFLTDDDVSEVMVNGAHEVYVERHGRLELTSAHFPSEESLQALVRDLAADVGRTIDARRPMLDARLPDGSRVNAVMPPLAVRGTYLTIRRFPRQRLTLEQLVSHGALNDRIAAFLRAAVEGRMSVIVSGGTGSGKTTLLSALCAFFPPTERIVTIEDAAELRLPQRHVLPLESQPADGDSRGAVSIRDLVRNALRMRPDRIVVGEVRGDEAIDMLQALNSGHAGSLSTIHANSPREALGRLETLVLMAGTDLPARAVREQIVGAIRLVLQCSRTTDGKRIVSSVTELSGLEGPNYTMGEIFAWDEARGFVSTGYVPRLRDRLIENGVPVDNAWFRS
jgi:pilus assembly protein CpaF